MNRRQQVHQETFEQILEVARQEMRANGVAALSMTTLARRLGMATPSLYTYVSGKEEIYDELFRRGFEAFGRAMDAWPAPDASPAGNLEGVMRTYMHFAQANPELFQLMFQRPAPGFTPSEASMAVSLAQLERARVQFGHIWQGGDVESALNFVEARDLFIALQHGLTELHLANEPHLPAGEGRFGSLIPRAVEMVLSFR